MTTRSPTAKGIEVPDLVGDKADQAIQTLRELGLMPVTWSAAVADVKEAGFVLGLEPPAGTTVRAKTLITLSVATHPDFQGHDVDLDLPPDRPMQPPLAWPLSAPTGFAQPHHDTAPPTVTVAFPSAAAPAALSAPASPPLAPAFGEIPQQDADASAEALTPGTAADVYLEDVSAPVPIPDELAADDEWDRLCAAEAARHAAQHPSADPATPQAAPESTPLAADPDDFEPEAASEDQARRDARRRSARRYPRLTGKQKALTGGVLALTLLLVAAALSGHKPAHQAAHAGGRPRTPSARKPSPRAVLPHTTATTPPRPVVRVRTRTRVVTVTVSTPSPHPRPSHSSSHTTAASGSSSYTSPVSTHTSEAPAVTPSVTDSHTAPASSPQPSVPESAHPTSGGTGGGSTLQSPDGATAPPQP